MKALRIKIFLTSMFATGLLLWDVIDVEWEYFRMIQAIHVIGSIIVSILFVIPFVNKHVYAHTVTKKVKSLDGWLLGAILLSLTISGFYLFLVGNRGGDLWGRYSFYVHLYGSFLLIFLLFYHIKKSQKYIAPIILAFGVFYPAPSQANERKFTSLKIENNATVYHNQDWTSSAKCKSCHSDIFNQWADSNHKNLVESNPYYMVMEGLAGEIEGEEFREWCMGCHNPSAVTTGLTKTGHAMDRNLLTSALFEKGAKTLLEDFKAHGSSRLEEGVSCVACHRITEAKSAGDGSYALDLQNRERYVFEDSKSALGQWIGEKLINSNPKVHKQSYSNDLYKKSGYCASCHDESSPITGKAVVSTFKEWEKSPYNDPKNPQERKDCVDCHMTYLKDGKFAPLMGASTDGGKIKKDVKVHYFSGSNYFLSGLKSKEHEDQTTQLLRTAAKLDVEMKNDQLLVGVKNVGAGHHLPTGVADFRELWLDVTLKDADGKVVVSSGKLKEDGNLGEDARPFMKVFGDKEGNPVGLLFWRYETLLSDTRIPAGERRVESYEVKETKMLKYPLSVVVKLNFRIYPQWVTDAVRKTNPQLPDPNVITLNEIEKVFTKK